MGLASKVRKVELRVTDPRPAPEPSRATSKIRDALIAIADEVNAEGVLFGDRSRLVVDLAPNAPIRNPESREIPLYTSTYFLGLVGHPNLNPIIVRHLEEHLGAENLASLLAAVRPWYSLADDFEGQRLGPIGCSGLFFARDGAGEVHFLIGRRSRTCAVSVDAWTTTLDEGIANLVGWHEGQLRNAVVQELGLLADEGSRFLTEVRNLGWLVPSLSSVDEGRMTKIAGRVLQSGANAVFGSLIGFDDLVRLADGYNATHAKGAGGAELSEFAVWTMDEIIERDDVFTEILVAACAAIVDQVDSFTGEGL